MILSRILIFICLMINVQADLIGWNRARNNELKHTYRRVADFNIIDLIDQYQQFFSTQGRNAEFIRARKRSYQKFQKQNKPVQ